MNMYIVKTLHKKGDLAVAAIQELKGYVKALRESNHSEEDLEVYDKACSEVEKKIMDALEN